MNYSISHTVREYFHWQLLPECVSELRPNTIKEIRTALNHWERVTDNPPVRSVTPDHVRKLRDSLLADGLAPATVKKVWAHLSTIFRAATHDNILPAVPQAGRLRKAILPKELRRVRSQQRRPVTSEELTRLFVACDSATYPRRPDCATLWRALLYFFWMYGPRTRDLFSMTAGNVNAADSLLQFTAFKTSKLQGVPLTPLGLSIIATLTADGRQLLFPGFTKPGNWNQPRDGAAPHWIPGYYAAWNADICPAAGVMPHTGPASLLDAVSSRPDAVPAIQLKTLRQTMVTQLNDFSSRVSSCRQLGAWVAGHHQPGVTAESYDFPENDIRAAVLLRETQLLPACFREYFSAGQ